MTARPDLPGATSPDSPASPLDRAIDLLLAGEREAALRWAAAVVAQGASQASAILITSRLLADAGEAEAAKRGFEHAIARAIDTGNLPLAVAAALDLRAIDDDAKKKLDDIASAFCKGSPRLTGESPVATSTPFHPRPSIRAASRARHRTR